jgi:hypothetical protein
MLRTASSLPLAGLLTLGSDPARFQTEPPACYRASWQLPGPDFHRQATTSLRTARSAATSQRHLPLCWAHESSRLAAQGDQRPGNCTRPAGTSNRQCCRVTPPLAARLQERPAQPPLAETAPTRNERDAPDDYCHHYRPRRDQHRANSLVRRAADGNDGEYCNG